MWVPASLAASASGACSVCVSMLQASISQTERSNTRICPCAAQEDDQLVLVLLVAVHACSSGFALPASIPYWVFHVDHSRGRTPVYDHRPRRWLHAAMSAVLFGFGWVYHRPVRCTSAGTPEYRPAAAAVVRRLDVRRHALARPRAAETQNQRTLSVMFRQLFDAASSTYSYLLASASAARR